MKAIVGVRALAIAAMTVAIGCGGYGGGSGSDYSPTGPSGGGNVESGATITIGTDGAIAPTQVTINVGQAATFTNNSNRTRNIESDPHPAHSDCTAINSVNLLAAGQTKRTGTFTVARTCGFHDHDDPDNPALKGTIIVR